MTPSDSNQAPPRIRAVDVTMAYGDFVIQRDLSFDVARGEIFIIMGGSGCGKSTLLRHMIGLLRPAKGDVRYDGASFWGADDDERHEPHCGKDDQLDHCGPPEQDLCTGGRSHEATGVPVSDSTRVSPGGLQSGDPARLRAASGPRSPRRSLAARVTTQRSTHTYRR